MADTGNTSTIAFATSSFTASYEMIGGTEQSREALEDSHVGLAAGSERTYIADDIFEGGGFESRFFWDQSATVFPPIAGAAETITITYPLKSGEATAATLVGTGFLTRSKGPDLENSNLMRGEYTVKWDGKTGPTYTAGSSTS